MIPAPRILPVLLAVSFPILAETHPAEEDRVLAVEDEYVAAEIRRDEAALRRIVDDRFVMNSNDGTTSGKEALIRSLLAMNMTGQTIAERTVTIDGNTALVFGTAEIRHAGEGGAQRTTLLRYTSTYVNRQGEWRMIALHMAPRTKPPVPPDLEDFAARYTAAWCSGDPARVAAFFSEKGSLTINDGTPSVGRPAITEAARGFMTAFPDMVVTMDGTEYAGDRVLYRWSLTGTNTGPGGTGRTVRISGHEAWLFGPDGLISDSRGHFDEADYRRQISGDAPGAR